MSQAAPAVALLFDDVELGGQLREALTERGAHIVHEGEVSTLTRELLQKVGAQVLVVSLDDSADDALDQLYTVIDGDYPRVVFNDAQASRALVGWDRARWARHLAVKVLAMGDVDPPRPDQARGIEPVNSDTLEAAIARESLEPSVEEVAPASTEENAAERSAIPAVAESTDDTATLESPFASPLLEASHGATDGNENFNDHTGEPSDDLAAELEALLASGDLSYEDDASSTAGLRFATDENPPPLHDGNFDIAANETAADFSASPETDSVEPTGQGQEPAARVATPTFQLDHLELTALTDALLVDIPAATLHVSAVAEVAPPAVPDSWALLDDDVDVSTDTFGAADIGVEKLSAADFLAPEVERPAPDSEAVMSLKLVSMEEAIAPAAFEGSRSKDAGSQLGQLVLLGATVSGLDSVCSFLQALPQKTSLTFVLAQHLGDLSVDELAEKLSAHCALPVRIAKADGRALAGELLVVPAGQQLLLIRDGSVDLMPSFTRASQGPSIDASFSMAANVFGQDALAIVFAGRGTDAVAGSQAIRDRGGEVWGEAVADEHADDMVGGIVAERLISFSGTPHELAARLIEVFP